MKQYIHTFEHGRYPASIRASAFARNDLAGIARCAIAAGLKPKRDKAGHWQFLAYWPMQTAPEVYRLR